MLLERRVVNVPADPELDADVNEYGHLGCKIRAAFGLAAVEAGTPDFGQNDGNTDAVDAIANILHHIEEAGGEVEVALGVALGHYWNERKR